MPAGAGRKGSKAPRRRAKAKATPTEDNRAPLNTSSFSGQVFNVGSSGASLTTTVPHPPTVWHPWAWANQFLHCLFLPPLQNLSVSCFKFSNVSVCNGCRNRFTTVDTIVVRHSLQVLWFVTVYKWTLLWFCQFTSPRTGLPASKYGNVYYHARRCLEL